MKRAGIIGPVVLGLSAAAMTGAVAAPMTYEIDPNHTYPSFEADHMGGLSKWRGKINSTSGSITLDRENQTGSVEIVMDMNSIDFGHGDLNDHAKTPDMFNTAEYPTARYEGELVNFEDGAPTAVDGELTMHGMTQPLMLDIESFKCQPHPQRGVEVCGATATAQLNRADYGVDFGQNFGFDMGVTLDISVEAFKQE